MKKFTRVVVARRMRVGRCHGGKIIKRPVRPLWYLWLACGHLAHRVSEKVPRKVKCDRCEFDLRVSGKRNRDWFKVDLPKGLGAIRL